jgi:hypothetical protein
MQCRFGIAVIDIIIISRLGFRNEVLPLEAEKYPASG